MTDYTGAVGFYGKLPTLGDFVRRRLPDSFVEQWDAWLQECMAAGRRGLGSDWVDVYLTSPVWRFACATGACGELPVIGVFAPSVDRVGRCFPFTIAASLSVNARVATIAIGAEPFFERAERLILQAVTADHHDLDAFDAQVQQLEPVIDAVAMAPVMVNGPMRALLHRTSHDGWRIPIPAASSLGSTFMQLVAGHLDELYAPLVIWWTDGSDDLTPTCVLQRGLPAPGTFVTLVG